MNASLMNGLNGFESFVNEGPLGPNNQTFVGVPPANGQALRCSINGPVGSWSVGNICIRGKLLLLLDHQQTWTQDEMVRIYGDGHGHEKVRNFFALVLFECFGVC